MSCALGKCKYGMGTQRYRNYSPTTVNIELDEYEHQMIDRLVRRYPNKPSRGTSIPKIATRTSGSRQ